MRTLVVILLVRVCGSTSHKAVAKTALNAEIGREGQILMRHDNPKKEVPKAALAELHKRPIRRGPAEATEAFARPSKIDDSLFAGWAPRMPSFIEREPWFYSMVFVGTALLFMGAVCFYVQYEDSKDEERRELVRNVRRRAVAQGGLPRRMGASFLSRGAAPSASTAAPRAAAPPSPAALRAAAEALEKEAAAREPAVTTPKPRATRAMAAAENSMAALSNAVGNTLGVLAGENVKAPKWGASLGAAEASTTSGASTPRSQLSSQHSSTGSGSSRSKHSGIRNGTMLVARMPEVIFASTKSWQEIGYLDEGQQVMAAGSPEMVDSYTMVPIKPRGAVDLKTLEVMREY